MYFCPSVVTNKINSRKKSGSRSPILDQVKGGLYEEADMRNKANSGGSLKWEVSGWKWDERAKETQFGFVFSDPVAMPIFHKPI